MLTRIDLNEYLKNPEEAIAEKDWNDIVRIFNEFKEDDENEK